MTAIIIQEYQPTDWESLAQIHDDARKVELMLAGLEAAFVPLKDAAINEGLFDYSVRVARIGNEVVGFTAYSEDELAWLYIHPDHMRKGVGKALVKYALENTCKRPFQIEVMQGNTPAIKLYEAMGFQTSEIVTGSMPGNECFQVTVHRMERH